MNGFAVLGVALILVIFRNCFLISLTSGLDNGCAYRNQSKISYRASMGCGNEFLLKWSWSHDQDGRHAHIWYNSKKIFFSGTKRPMILNLGMHHWVLEYYQVCSNDDPELNLTYFMARSNLVPYAFVCEKGKTMDFQKLNMSALKCYFASFNIFFFKRDITLNVGKWYQILWDTLHIV